MNKYALIQLGCLNCNVPTKIIAIFSHYINAYNACNLCCKYETSSIRHFYKIIKVPDISFNIPNLSDYVENCSIYLKST